MTDTESSLFDQPIEVKDENEALILAGKKTTPYSAGFFMLIALGIGFTIIGSMIAIPLVAAMSGKSIIYLTEHLQDMMQDARYLREMQVLQVLSAVIGFLVPTLIVASRLNRYPMRLTGFKGAISQKQIGLTVLIIICGLALSDALGYFSYKLPIPVNWRITFDRLENNYSEAAAGLINLDSIPELILSIVVLALIPAVCEESFFRGGLQNYLYRSTGKLWMSVVIVSVIFSAVHFSVYGFLSRVVLGMVLGLLFQYSGRIWLNILAHFINNAAAVVVMYVQKSNGKTMQQILSDKDGSYVGFIVLPIIIFLLIQYRKSGSLNLTTSHGI